MCGGALGQDGGLSVGPRLLQGVQQIGRRLRIVEGGVCGGPPRGTVVSGVQRMQVFDQGGCGVRCAVGSGALEQLGAVALKAPGSGGVVQRCQLCGVGVPGGAVLPAVLVQVVGQPPYSSWKAATGQGT
ncbi:hypothetical protein ABZ907_26180 [Nonomuraea wenchangensis]